MKTLNVNEKYLELVSVIANLHRLSVGKDTTVDEMKAVIDKTVQNILKNP